MLVAPSPSILTPTARLHCVTSVYVPVLTCIVLPEVFTLSHAYFKDFHGLAFEPFPLESLPLVEI